MTLGRDATVVGHFARMWLLARVLGPRLDKPALRSLVQRLSRETLALLRVEIEVHGVPPAEAMPVLVAANHVSWLDVWAINALSPARFVAKAEVAHWPVAGTITRGFGSVFIRRGCPRDAWRVKNRLAEHLRHGEHVAGFPEGTTTDGSGVGPFHPAIFQAAVDAGAEVPPVAIRYRAPDGSPCPESPFVGDMTFLESLAKILGAKRISAEVTFLPRLEAGGRSRKYLAAAARAAIAQVLDLPLASASQARFRHAA
jgi:1-acyl-sn-glycerol-3-phosphate acyltransferase